MTKGVFWIIFIVTAYIAANFYDVHGFNKRCSDSGGYAILAGNAYVCLTPTAVMKI